MPRKRRGVKKRRRTCPSLWFGLSVWNPMLCGFGPETDEELQAGWVLVRDTLLPAYIASRPGERPWAWWEFQVPEPCRSGPPPPEKPGRKPMPSMLAGYRESSLEYLTRLDLLSAAEKHALAERECASKKTAHAGQR